MQTQRAETCFIPAALKLRIKLNWRWKKSTHIYMYSPANVSMWCAGGKTYEMSCLSLSHCECHYCIHLLSDPHTFELWRNIPVAKCLIRCKVLLFLCYKGYQCPTEAPYSGDMLLFFAIFKMKTKSKFGYYCFIVYSMQPMQQKHIFL